MYPALLALEDRRLLAPLVGSNPPLLVSNPNDSGDGSLRAAIEKANALGGANTINFDPTVFATLQTITLNSTELTVTDNGLTINGPAGGVNIVPGQIGLYVFHINDGADATISGITCVGRGDQPVLEHGGGVENRGTVTLINCGFVNLSTPFGSGVDNKSKATVKNCTFNGCDSEGTSEDPGTGGAVYNKGDIRLDNCTFDNNVASYGGGMYNDGTANLFGCTFTHGAVFGFFDSGGAGFYNNSTANFTNCTFAENTAGNSTGTFFYGGGLYNNSDTTLISCTFTNNKAYQGGAIYANRSLDMWNTLISTNTATNSYPDIDGTIHSGGNNNPAGGHNLISNTAGSSGWGSTDQQNKSAQITSLGFHGGPTQTVAIVPSASNPAFGNGDAHGVTTDQRGFPVDNPVDIGAFQVQRNTLFQVNTTIGSARAPLGTLSLPDAVNLANGFPSANTITFDPTVFATQQTITLADGQLRLTNKTPTEAINGPAAGVTISAGGRSRVFQVDGGVTASFTGLNITGGNSDRGGGVLVLPTAKLTLSNCTFSGNTVSGGGGGLANSGNTSLTNCTVSGNTAGGGGGGVFNDSVLFLVDCTISNNKSALGGGVNNQGGTANVDSTIIAANTAPKNATDFAGPAVSKGHNLVGKIEGSSGWIATDMTGTFAKPLDPKLAPLGNYGGPTQTMAPLVDSPALGNGDPSNGVTTDQRGLARGARLDIGAFQASLVVKSASASVVTSPISQLTLPGANSLANAFASLIITFDPAVKNITLAGSHLELSNTLGLLTILGPGVTISGGGQSRVFLIDSKVSASLSGLTITGGDKVKLGGGILNIGHLTMSDCTVTGNKASQSGGGLANNGGTTDLKNCTFSNNTATEFGGGVYHSDGVLSLTNCTLSANTAGSGGDGLYGSNGKLTIKGSTIAGVNTAIWVVSHANVTISGGVVSTGKGKGVVVGTDETDTCSVTIDHVNLAANDTGVENLGPDVVNARLNWWGSANGPDSPGAAHAVGAVVVNPWLGDTNSLGLAVADSLGFIIFTSRAYEVTPITTGAGSPYLSVALLGDPSSPWSVTPKGTILFVGTSGAVTINGQTGTGFNVDKFTLANGTVSFATADAFGGAKIQLGNGLSPTVIARGTSNTFDASQWTGSAALKTTQSGGTVVASRPAGYTLTDTSLVSTDGLTLSLSGINVAKLTDTAGGHTFAVSGWTGTGSLADTGGTADTVAASKAADFVLSDASLKAGKMVLTLQGIKKADLTDTAGGKTFDVGGWTGTGSITDTALTKDTIIAKKAAGFTLANASLSATDNMSLALSGVGTAKLTDTAGSNSFTVSGWTGNGALANTGPNGDTVAASKAAGYTLSNTALTSTDTMSLTLSGFAKADLADTAGGKTFDVSGWKGTGSLTGVFALGETAVASKDSGFTLTDSLLSTSDGMAMALSGINTANLTDIGNGHSFNLTGWTGGGSLQGTSESLIAGVSASTVLTNTSLAVTGLPAVALSGFTSANLAATASGLTFVIVNASAFTGPTTLMATGSGNLILIGGQGANTLTDNGTGRNILIGGGGPNAITGNGNDILISGTTSYDANTPANVTALDAILAEWASADLYQVRINKINGGLAGGYKFDDSTVSWNGKVNTIHNGSLPTPQNWLLVNKQKDSYTEQGQVVTNIN